MYNRGATRKQEWVYFPASGRKSLACGILIQAKLLWVSIICFEVPTTSYNLNSPNRLGSLSVHGNRIASESLDKVFGVRPQWVESSLLTMIRRAAT